MHPVMTEKLAAERIRDMVARGDKARRARQGGGPSGPPGQPGRADRPARGP